MKNRRHAALSARAADLVPSKGNTAALRSAAAFATGVDVDVEAGVIRNAAVMTVGPALGHGFNIDATTIRQVADLINAAGEPGVVVRYKHPQPNPDGTMPDALGTDVGYVRNARVEGDVCRGDVFLAEHASNLPGYGDVRSYLLKKAKNDPKGFGLSAVIGFDAEVQMSATGQPEGIVARVFTLDAVDFVGQPAANPHGLLNAKPAPVAPAAAPTKPTHSDSGASPGIKSSSQKGVQLMDPILKDLLVADLGLDPSATDEQAKSFYEGLSADQRSAVDQKLASMSTTAAPAGASMSARKPAAPVAPVIDDGERLVALENRRVAQLNQLGTLLKVPDEVVRVCIGENLSVADARVKMLQHVHQSAKPVASIKVGEDRNRASLTAAIPQAIMLRADVKVENPHERAVQLRGQTLVDMGRHYLAAMGVPDVWQLSRVRVTELLLSRRELGKVVGYAALAESSSDFTSVLADTINKTLRQAYLDAPSTWNLWARRATNPDFKTITRAALSESPDLVSRNEGGSINYVTLADGKETYALSEYVGGIKLTRRAIINDDLDAFGRIPLLQGNAAKRKEDDVAYAIITANANMADGGALFNSTAVTTTGGHANLTSSGTVLSVASLAIGETAVMTQKGPKNAARLELQPKFLLVPIAIKATAYQLINSTADPAKSNSGANNPYAGKYTVIPSTRLNDSSATAWYLMADYRDGQIDTVEVCFLADEPEPVAKQETDFDTEDVKYAIRHTVAAKAIDWRGVYKNVGA